MAKKKFDLSNLNSPSPKNTPATSKLTDDAVAKIHGTESRQPESKKMGRPRRQEAVTRLTVDLPKHIHKKLKMRATDQEISLRQLVIDVLMNEVEKY